MRLDTTHNATITVDGKPYRVATDLETGQRMIKIAEVVPDPVDEKTQQLHDAVMSKNPVHFSSDVSGYTGYWVPAPAAAPQSEGQEARPRKVG